MATNAKNIAKNDEILKKAQADHKARKKKYMEAEAKRVAKALLQTKYLEHDVTDEQLVLIIKKGIELVMEETPEDESTSNASTSH